MSPIGKPTPDGEIILGSRHYGGKTLGDALIWKCPACGVQNEGRKPERGCGHCGAGDPGKSKAGTGQPHVPDTGVRAPVDRPSTTGSPRPPVSAVVPQPVTIYRIIEYTVRRPEMIAAVLRNSLVGTLEMDWGTLTATIIDSLDGQQQDRLRMARMQPGVWLANKEAMARDAHPWQVIAVDPELPVVSYAEGSQRALDYFERAFQHGDQKMDMPDTGPTWTAQQEEFAQIILSSMGPQVANTLALALANIAEELQGNLEPEKFMRPDDCLQLANALLHALPAEWQESVQDAPPPAPIDDAERTRRQAIRERLGEKPIPTYREPPQPE